MTDPAPIVLNDRYELRGLLGRGGMAEVYLGFDLVLGREVAVKIMHAALAADVRLRFASETRLLAGLNNPHLVMLLDAGLDDRDGVSRPWLVMELVTGGTLASRIAAGPLPPQEVAAIGAGLATALSHVHANGIVHRDVKPSNVLVTESGLTKLADFGVARLVDEQSDLTATGFTIGTAAYLAPEQVRGLPLTGASDVYSLGLVLLEALTAQRAYTGTPVEAALARLHRKPLIPVSLGAAWVQLLDAMTAVESAERPEAGQVAAQLAAIRGGAEPAAVVLDPTSTMAIPASASMSLAGADLSTGPAKERSRRRRTLAGAAAVAVVLLAAGLTWASTGGTDSPPPAAGAVESSRLPEPMADGIRRTTAPPSSPTSSTTNITPVKVDRPATKKHQGHGAQKVKSKPHKAKKKHGKSGKGHGHGNGHGNGHGKGGKGGKGGNGGNGGNGGKGGKK